MDDQKYMYVRFSSKKIRSDCKTPCHYCLKRIIWAVSAGEKHEMRSNLGGKKASRVVPFLLSVAKTSVSKTRTQIIIFLGQGSRYPRLNGHLRVRIALRSRRARTSWFTCTMGSPKRSISTSCWWDLHCTSVRTTSVSFLHCLFPEWSLIFCDIYVEIVASIICRS